MAYLDLLLQNVATDSNMILQGMAEHNKTIQRHVFPATHFRAVMPVGPLAKRS